MEFYISFIFIKKSSPKLTRLGGEAPEPVQPIARGVEIVSSGGGAPPATFEEKVEAQCAKPAVIQKLKAKQKTKNDQ